MKRDRMKRDRTQFLVERLNSKTKALSYPRGSSSWKNLDYSRFG